MSHRGRNELHSLILDLYPDTLVYGLSRGNLQSGSLRRDAVDTFLQ